MTKTEAVHSIQGTYEPARHDKRKENEESTAIVNAPIQRPTALTGKRANEIWDGKVKILPWLTNAESEMLCMYCMLISEFEADPTEFSASKMNVVIKLASDLGMTPISRGKFKYDGDKKSPGSHLFDS